MPIKRPAVSSGFNLLGTSFKAPFDMITIRKIGKIAPKKKE